jgi:hypothetical protein
MTEPEEKPPVLKSWKNLYLLIAGFLILQIVIYYYLTVYFS